MAAGNRLRRLEARRVGDSVMRSRNGSTSCRRCGRLAERLPLLFGKQTVSLLFLFLRQFNARAATPAIRNHEPRTHREGAWQSGQRHISALPSSQMPLAPELAFELGG